MKIPHRPSIELVKSVKVHRRGTKVVAWEMRGGVGGGGGWFSWVLEELTAPEICYDASGFVYGFVVIFSLVGS